MKLPSKKTALKFTCSVFRAALRRASIPTMISKLKDATSRPTAAALSLWGDMTLNHVHFQVRDLNAAVTRFDSVLQLQPGFEDERIATFSFDAMTIIIGAGISDSPATLGFEGLGNTL